MTCERCGRESASAVFCTWCGARQGTAGGTGMGRRGEQFAAHPNEPVLHPAVFTTLFPHLVHHKVNEFRWAVVIGVSVVTLLYLAGLIAAAILVGAILVPVVYLLYLYEVRVYRDAPVRVLGLTLGAGFVIGVIFTLIVDSLAGGTPLMRLTPFGLTVDITGVALFVIAVPVLQEAVKPLAALTLRGSSDFPETIDGIVFGVAAGLGFAAAETIVHFSQVITTVPIQTEPGNWIYPLATITIFVPLMQGTATGLITGAVWQLGRRPLGTLAAGGIAAAVIGHVAFVFGSELADAMGNPPIVGIGWQAIVVGALLIALRILLHRALLDEAADMGLSQTVCTNCESHITAAGFCPVCGMAQTAVPRTAGGVERGPGTAIRPEGA